MNSHSQILVQIAGGSEASRILDWVERGCRRLMLQGGGALSKEQPKCKRRMSAEDRAKVIELRSSGKTLREIENLTGWSNVTVMHCVKRGC